MTTRTAPRWELHRGHSPDGAAALARDLGAPAPIGQILWNRGLNDVAAARRFVEPRLEDLHSPFALLGMEAAVERIERALARRERVLVHGDYDVDGLTATYVLLSTLRAFGADVHAHIPHRMKEGYGLSTTAIEAAARAGMTLVITVDCGISAHEPVAHAAALGVGVVITDHHEPPAVLPPALAIVNPHQPGCTYPFKGLCGVGVAFKLAQALAERRGAGAVVERLLEFVALGTVADAVPLSGENRVLVHHGLERLSRTDHLGLQALIEVAGLSGRRITAGQVAFQLAPRLNAAGRVGSALQALRLLTAEDADEARALAQSLDQDNTHRRELDERVEREAAERVERELQWPACSSIVLWADDWHPGVLGIAASRMVERFHRPAILIGVQGAWGRGSGRSAGGLDLHRLLGDSANLLTTFGGHAYAAGLTVERERLPALRLRIEELARERLDLDACVPRLVLDADLSFGAIDLELLTWLERLPPHGLDNPEPVFRVARAMIDSLSRVGNGRHLKLWLR
ncbi:MAG: single-stranded-DNA-specific exonuclease RecJ [Candidatus Eisenbacteria bacterium]|uniref:Single-stranded-DNA-specific exonuclease RecJ n=1 Tax=Eiseniibacteriota bacterium TaxID=2212470 RepID=A0A538U8B8_UNCEI|nr:MAG: single-stranded-DNA-specific exonuclease RecJ [Candidatus Eisenbacteria bacterium]